ncbi:hypothetical protein GCM10009415_49270 [Chitinophaga japonensis]
MDIYIFAAPNLIGAASFDSCPGKLEISWDHEEEKKAHDLMAWALLCSCPKPSNGLPGAAS